MCGFGTARSNGHTTEVDPNNEHPLRPTRSPNQTSVRSNACSFAAPSTEHQARLLQGSCKGRQQRDWKSQLALPRMACEHGLHIRELPNNSTVHRRNKATGQRIVDGERNNKPIGYQWPAVVKYLDGGDRVILNELMRTGCEVITAVTDTRLSEAAALMREHRIGSVVIVNADEKVIGIVTDRDIAMVLALGAGTPDSTLEETMSRDVQTVPESMSLFDVTQRFRDADVKRFPVVDRDDKVVGIVSTEDVMAHLAREMFDTCSALEPKLGHIV